ncbi:MAG: carbohydrate kinase family protein, partial [Acidobacteria bacterium]|nr:carbohydrate kinase family protein [Acidobacteriota bacterium]
ECVDSTGAGDVFAGAYLAALWRGADDREAGRRANAVGALSVQQLGAVTGVLGWEETGQWMAAHSAASNQVW